MAKKRETLKINVNDMFLDGVYATGPDYHGGSVAMKSKLWPVAVAAYAACEGKARIAEYKTTVREGESENTERICLTTEHGFRIGYVTAWADGQISVNATNGLLGSADGSSASLTTNSIRYAISKLTKSDHDVRSGLRGNCFGVGDFLSDRLRSMVDKTIDTFYGESISSVPQIKLEEACITALAQVHMKELDINKIHPSIQSRMEQAFADYKSRRAKFNDALDKTKEIFNTNKIVFIPDVRDGFIVGKIKTDMINDNVSQYPINVQKITPRLTGHLPTSNGEKYFASDKSPVIPLRWYPSIEVIPEDLRRELEIQLVMLKAHTGSPTLIPNLQGIGTKVWDAVGAIYYSYYGQTPIILLNG